MANLPAGIHPLQNEVISRRKSGWHPVRIQRELHRLGHDIDLELVIAFCEGVEVTIPSALTVTLRGEDPIIDPFMDASQLIRIEQKRLAQLLAVEEAEGAPSPGVNSYINLLFHHLMDLIIAERERNVASRPPTDSAAIPTLKELLGGSDRVTIREITAEKNG
jgi:hypothetical protein